MSFKNIPLRGVVGCHINSTRVALITSGLLATFAGVAQAAPSLYFSQYNSVSGSLNTQYTSALLGDVNFSLNGTSDYQYGNNQLAHASYSVAAGNNSLTDPVYNLVTSNGQYGFSYDGTAQSIGTSLKTKMTSSVVDASGNLVNNAADTSLNTWAYSQWHQGFYIGTTANHAAGSYGAILVGITLDGSFPASSDPSIGNNASGYLTAQSNFSDAAGVSYASNFSVDAYNNSSWTGTATTFKKLLFQYGTTFDVALYQQLYGSNNSNADFFNTGKISSIELPMEAILETGAQQAGLGSLSELFGNVTNSTTLDAQNTTWDFGNNGGGFTPPTSVPVPAAVWMMGSGLLGLLGVNARRRVNA